ncbi:amidohydrolase family protein [Blastococcus sp. SYSU D00669]
MPDGTEPARRPAVRIIDAHCHAGSGDGFTGPWDTCAPLRKYLRRCDEAGIGASNLLAAFHSDYAVANEEVGRIVAGRPDRFSAFAFVHAERDRGRVLRLVRHAVVAWGFCGIKVHRHDARISREICEVARLLRLPVLYDVMGEVATADLLAAEFPDVDFIIPHLGSFSDDWGAQRSLCTFLAERPNLYTDTSGVRRFDLLERAVRRAGPHKVLFGSDGPELHPGLELAKIRLLRLPRDAESLVLGGNFLRLTRSARRRHLPAGVAPVVAPSPVTTARRRIRSRARSAVARPWPRPEP